MDENDQDTGKSASWTRQGLQLPPNIAKEFKDATSTQAAFGGVQVMGTAAIAMFLGMPQYMRDAICDYVVRNAWKGLDGVTSENAWKAVIQSMQDELDRTWDKHDDPETTRYYLDKICSPEFLASKPDSGPKVGKIDTTKIPPAMGKKASKGKAG